MKSIKMLMMAALTIFSVTVFAQEIQKSKKVEQKTEHVKYSCPMHPDLTSKKPGKCSQCGMDLTKSKKEKMNMGDRKMYSCPMHADVTGDMPGKCSKCGMDMKEKGHHAMLYACPMKCEGEKTYDKEGKCPVCGMNLKLKKDEHEGHNH